MKKTIIIFVLLIILSIPSIKSLLSPGGYTSHDLTHHIVRQIDMDKLLSEGQFPPRWSGDLNNGYGYPLFLFNYPAPAIIGEAFHEVGFNFVESVKAVMFVSMLISVIGMYLFLESLLPGKKMASFLGAIFYLYAPIRFINIYVSATVGASLAMGILPFIFWLIVKLKDGKKWAVIPGSILTALLITSHNVTAVMFAPVTLVFSLVLIYKSSDKPAFIKKLLLMFGLGLGLSAFFWVPALFEKKFIVYDQIMGKSWVGQFPTIMQLIHSPWGYGLAHPGVNEPGAMSFQIGLAQILVMFILAGAVIFFRKKKELVIWGIFSIFTFSLAVFLMLGISAPLWANLPLLYLVQYPYRFLAVAVFAASIASALIIEYLPFKKILFVVLIAFVLYANRNHLNINQKFDPGDAYYMTLENQTTSYNEHLPIWAYVPDKKSEGKLTILSGKGNIKITENRSAKVTAEIDLTTESVLRFNQFYFPGWVLTDNGNPVQFSYTESGEDRGLPVFKLEKGANSFEAEFTNTVDRKIADYLSLASLVILGSILILSISS